MGEVFVFSLKAMDIVIDRQNENNFYNSPEYYDNIELDINDYSIDRPFCCINFIVV